VCPSNELEINLEKKEKELSRDKRKILKWKGKSQEVITKRIWLS